MRASGAGRSEPRVRRFLPFSPCGRRWRGWKSAPDEGAHIRQTPHPSRTRFTRPCHPLPQGEKEEEPRRQHGSTAAASTPRCRSMTCSTSSRARSRKTTPRCWSRRPAPARPRGCRWRCSTSRGRGQEDHRAGAAPDRGPRRAERMAKTLGETRRRDRRLPRPLRLEDRRARPASRWSPRAFSRRQILDDPELDGVAAVLFDEFHERSLDADLGLALARDAQVGLREDLRILVMSATLDGARVAKLLGDAAGDRERGPRLSGRDPLSRPRARRAARAADGGCRCAGAARRPGSVLAFLPGAAEIRRTRDAAARAAFTIRRSRSSRCIGALDAGRAGSRHRAGAAGPTQGGAGDLDRRDVADHRGRAHRRRLRLAARAALRAGHRSDAAGDACASRAPPPISGAAAPAAPSPGVCYRLWDEPQNGVARGLYAGPKSSPPTCRRCVLDSRLGRQRSRQRWRFSIRRPPAAEARHTACCANSTRSMRDGRITERGTSLRALPLPPRLARMIVDAGRDGHAGEAARDRRGAERARPRRRQCRSRCAARSVSPRSLRQRAGAARQQAERWVRQLQDQLSSSSAQTTDELSTGVLLSLAFPDRVARNRGNGRSCSPTAAARSVDQTSALARAPYLAVGELTGAAANGRILLAAPITLVEIELRFAERRSKPRTRSRSIAAAMSLRGARRNARCMRSRLSEQPMTRRTDRRTPRACWPTG